MDSDDEDSSVRKSSLKARLFLALLIGEAFGLIVVFGIGEARIIACLDFIGRYLPKLPYFNVSLGTAGAIFSLTYLYHMIVDLPFDIIWPILCRDLYRTAGWGKIIVDESYFFGIDKIISPVVIGFQNSAAMIFVYLGFSITSSTLLAAIIQIPPYIIIFTVLSTPLLAKREKHFSS